MNFIKTKSSILSRADKSNKGSIDTPIKPLIEVINSFSEYCTTSSCSGRVTIFVERSSDKKNEMKFLFASHAQITSQQVATVMKDSSANLWLRFEPLIIHVACSSLEAAARLLSLSRQQCKHSGILSISDFPVIEIRGSEFIEAPIQINDETITDRALQHLCTSANKKLQKTHQQIRKLIQILKKIK